MRIAFYAPMKPPDHPVPSGDRRVGRLLIAAMERAGHQVEIANRFRSRDGEGDPHRQMRLARIGATRAERLLRLYGSRPASELPALWLTYHLYYKAPDWIGPRVAAGLGILVGQLHDESGRGMTFAIAAVGLGALLSVWALARRRPLPLESP